MFTKKVLLAALALGAHGGAALAQAAPPDDPKDAKKVETIEVTAQRLDAARNGLSPDTGSSIYKFDTKELQQLPLGDGDTAEPGDPAGARRRAGFLRPAARARRPREPAVPHQRRRSSPRRITRLRPVARHALRERHRRSSPGRCRRSTATAPPASSTSTPRAARSRTAASVGLPAAATATVSRARELHGSRGAFSYFLTGSCLRNDVGIENPTAARNAITTAPRRARASPTSRTCSTRRAASSLLFGSADNTLPDPRQSRAGPRVLTRERRSRSIRRPQRAPARENPSRCCPTSARSRTNVDYQVALFNRYTDVHYMPDPVGDLVFNGIAADDPAQQRRERRAGRPELPPGRPAHAAQRPLRAARALTRRQHLRRSSRPTTTATRRATCRSRSRTTAASTAHLYGRLPAGRVAADAEAHRELRRALRPGEHGRRRAARSPRLGLVYDLSTGPRLHAGYARYFTPPPTEMIDTTSVQAFLGTTNALPSDANTAVKSERTQLLRRRASRTSSRRTSRWASTRYYRNVRHLQDEGQFGNALIFSAFNYEKGRIYGAGALGELSRGRRHGLCQPGGVARAWARASRPASSTSIPTSWTTSQSHWVHLDHDQTLSASAGASYRLGEATLSADALFGSGLRNGFANSDPSAELHAGEPGARASDPPADGRKDRRPPGGRERLRPGLRAARRQRHRRWRAAVRPAPRLPRGGDEEVLKARHQP